MPVTKTAKRALRSSIKKAVVNKVAISKMEIAVRRAKKSHKVADVTLATSLVDRASKKKIIHPNKAARFKRTLSKLSSSGVRSPQGPDVKKASKRTSAVKKSKKSAKNK